MADAITSYLNLSDEELMKLPPPAAAVASDVVEDAATAVVAEDPAAANADTNTDAASDDQKDADTTKTEDAVVAADAPNALATADDGDDSNTGDAAATAAKTPDAPAGGKDAAATTERSDGGKAKAAAADAPDAATKDTKSATAATDAAAATEIDYKAAYERLTAPFKANGREITVKSVDDAISLMQMGVNYNKKMAALKPNLKLMKLLENNGLLNEDKIGFLIDLDKKNPAAINKLVADSKIDPMELSTEKASEYKQTAYAVDDREIELDTVLEELQGSTAYTRTLEIVSNKWDGASKQAVATQPQLLKVINDHVERGIYDIIHAELENERMLGRLNGLSDIEAYRKVGDAIHARGGFNHLAQGSAPAQKQSAAAPVIVVPKPVKAVDDDKLRDKRRAASSTKPAGSGVVTPANFNPLALSDEEFSKQVNNKFL